MNDPDTTQKHSFPPEKDGFGRYVSWPMAVMVVAICAFMAFAVRECSPGAQMRQLAGVGGSVARGMEKLVAAINEHQVTQSFVDHLQSMKPDKVGRLLVAEGKATEDYSTQDISWRGTATAALRVTASYHYYVSLSEEWELKVHVTPQGVVGEVSVPALKALEPSVDTSQLETQSANGWANWNGAQLADDLLKDLTIKLNRHAARQLPQYFPVAREAVEKFVRDWMLKEYNLPPGTPLYLHIQFRNEPEVSAELKLAPPPKG